MTLWSDFLSNQNHIIHKWTHYFPIYENHFARYVNRPVTFFEIGCGQGGSLQLWKRYLGPLAQIVGIDINKSCRAFEEDQIAVRIGDQKNPQFLSEIIEEFDMPNVVLDDGRRHSLLPISLLSYRTRRSLHGRRPTHRLLE